ncbi:MAG TPA: hydrogenase expression/formation protein HypE, partial [bacterium]|nr:hydrogenase expression/formation protein HypE [bacterium]
ISLLERVAESMAKTSRDAGVSIVAGDTKVVEGKGEGGIFITTSGIGALFTPRPISASRIEPGDAILINGSIADHGMAIMAAREELSFTSDIASDCASLAALAETLAAAVPELRFMRDATRGGLAAVLNESVEGGAFGIEIEENAIPLNESTAAACELLGLDPLSVANEGKLVAFVPEKGAKLALATMRAHPLGHRAAIIGRATAEDAGRVTLVTSVGTRRLVAMPLGSLLPRIC